MKRTILKITTLSLFAAVLLAVPMFASAAESTNAAAKSGSENTAPHKKHDILPFHGKIKAVDTKAMTLTVGERTFAITSETKITKDNLPATLSDGVVGEMVGGAYKKSTDGKLDATTINFGQKSDGDNKAKKNSNGENQDGGNHEK